MDGHRVQSIAGDGHCETRSRDPQAADAVSRLIRGALGTDQYPKIGETIDIP